MFRKDTNAGFRKVEPGCLGLGSPPTWTYGTGGRGEWTRSLSVTEFNHIQQKQRSEPVALLRAEGKCWWMFEGEIYWDDDGYDAEMVRLKVRERDDKEARKAEKLRQKYGGQSEP